MKAYLHFAAAVTTFLTALPGALLAQNTTLPFVYESSREYFGSGDFNGDRLEDVVIADKETGKYRLGYMSNTGLLSWGDNRPSGIKGISGFGIGRVLGTNVDGLVFASADANQITLVDVASPTAASRPVAVPFTAALGPSA
ncbi:MAG TPA: hypothetical protein VN673_17435, partial [Clostridia bacterium]|nr:hypothetical protein [Clostridia bacterium]